MASEPSLVILLLVSTSVDYLCGLKMATVTSRKSKKLLLALSVSVNVGLLFVFKYLKFFTLNIKELLFFFGLEMDTSSASTGYNFAEILLPVGISFYTFQTMAYSIQIYRGDIQPEKHFGKFALYVAFFPQLVAGPIERASRLIPQLKKKVYFNYKEIRKGIFYMAWGLFLKIVVADRLGIYVDLAFNDPEYYQGPPLILGHWFFGFQIYYDFAAYTAIAIGVAKTLGVDLIQNFNRPFFSKSADEFWRRWHISLMQWMRDYLYRPLIKDFKFNRLSAVLLVFFITGLWHGANWTFIIWGMLNALLLILEVATKPIRKKIIQKLSFPKRLFSIMGFGFIFTYIMFSLIFFRSPSLSHAILYIKNLFKINALQINILDNYFEMALSIFLILFVQTIHYLKGNSRIHELVFKRSAPMRWAIYICFIFVVVLFGLNRQNTFIYFQF
ncbi:MBOAT family protein [Flagellimonas sp. HMM57]|uniref:MBOAT family O-acyltransferase n=1 Tax=unclassified Flagellimonas TaxID=2644544 RepID=UPI001F0A3731|nr:MULTISPECIES: MBOAT family O-acyltransferase [unclassified Flagellimonas]UII76137.1 MBOAT family protein [Flagellimonas sp. HMM57]